MEPTIRSWRREDLREIRELLTQLTEVTEGPPPDLSLEHLEDVFAHMERSPDVYLTLVAAYGARVAGLLSLVFYQSLFHRGGSALVSELIVDRSYRDRGLGRLLVERAREEALSRGMDELEVSTERQNVDAQAFYRRCGFNEEHILMERELADDASKE
jgi:GNAT superfamily N-acetyltransferase